MDDTVTLLSALQAARMLLDDPANWTQHNYAIDSSGFAIDPTHMHAQKWCLIGALEAFDLPHGMCYKATDSLRNRLKWVNGDSSLAGYNDTHKHPQVLNLLDRTIAHVAARMEG